MDFDFIFKVVLLLGTLAAFAGVFYLLSLIIGLVKNIGAETTDRKAPKNFLRPAGKYHVVTDRIKPIVRDDDAAYLDEMNEKRNGR